MIGETDEKLLYTSISPDDVPAVIEALRAIWDAGTGPAQAIWLVEKAADKIAALPPYIKEMIDG